MRYRRLCIPGGTWFFTVVTHERRPIFADPDAVSALRRSIGLVRQRHPFAIHAAVVLPDHLHMIWQLPEDDAAFSIRWSLIKRRVTEALGGPPKWQKRFWDHLIRDDRDYANHVDYIHLNPLKHGLVKDPRDWPWTSLHHWLADGWYGPEGPPLEALDRLTVVGDP